MKFIVYVIQFFFIFVNRLQIFIVWTQISPTFQIKSNVIEKGLVAEIIGVNMKGIEIFKYELLDEKNI